MIVDEIAKTLCRAAAVATRPHEKGPCTYCDAKGRCNPKMWTTFRGEAIEVAHLLTVRGYLRPQKAMLPGLGAPL